MNAGWKHIFIASNVEHQMTGLGDNEDNKVISHTKKIKSAIR